MFQLPVEISSISGHARHTDTPFSAAVQQSNLSILIRCWLSLYDKRFRGQSCDSIMGFSIYTKTGDDGTSSLYTGERRAKDDAVFHALGDVDELNSAVGLAREFVGDLDPRINHQLETIQSRLLDVGSAVATPAETSGLGSDSKKKRTEFDEDAASALEGWIDQMDEDLPQLTSFILPSGGQASALLHVARSTCRRAERSVVPLAQSGSVHPAVLIFLNRLSDYLFTAARTAARLAGKEEVCYKKA